MDARSNHRRAVKSAQEQEDWRCGAETKETVLDVLQRHEVKDWESRGRGIMLGALLKLLVREKLPHSREVPPWTRKNGSWNLVSCQAYFSLGTRLAEILRGNWDRVIIMQRPQHMLPQLPLFQQCSIQSQDVMQTWLHWRRQDALLVQKHFVALFHPKPNECLHFDLESCNLMCTYTVVTNPCRIPPLSQARPMMLRIYTSI